MVYPLALFDHQDAVNYYVTLTFAVSVVLEHCSSCTGKHPRHLGLIASCLDKKLWYRLNCGVHAFSSSVILFKPSARYFHTTNYANVIELLVVFRKSGVDKGIE